MVATVNTVQVVEAEQVEDVEAALINKVKFILCSGAKYTIKSLVARLQRDLALSFRDADGLVWNGAGIEWSINLSSGEITPLQCWRT